VGLEGPTSVDCFIETKDFVLVIEGKRTEELSGSTEWVNPRNQLARNLEVAQNLSCGRRYGVLLIVGHGRDFTMADHKAFVEYLSPSLPHYDDEERDFLGRHFLGAITWQDTCAATGLNLHSLPDTSAEFYRKYASRLAAGPKTSKEGVSP
jgi:hypothetical protein